MLYWAPDLNLVQAQLCGFTRAVIQKIEDISFYLCLSALQVDDQK